MGSNPNALGRVADQVVRAEEAEMGCGAQVGGGHGAKRLATVHVESFRIRAGWWLLVVVLRGHRTPPRRRTAAGLQDEKARPPPRRGQPGEDAAANRFDARSCGDKNPSR